MTTQQQSPGFVEVIKSVLSSFFGVQSSKKHQQDITRGKPVHYILTGLAFTVLFVLTIWGVVSLVLHLAGV